MSQWDFLSVVKEGATNVRDKAILHLLQIPTSLACRYAALMSIDLQVLCDQFQL
jgi:hypothetical protein